MVFCKWNGICKSGTIGVGISDGSAGKHLLLNIIYEICDLMLYFLKGASIQRRLKHQELLYNLLFLNAF